MTGSAIGLVPAAGRAARLGEPVSSKELLRVWRSAEGAEPEPAIGCLLRSFTTAGLATAVVAVRPGKEDIRRMLGDAAQDGLRLEYVDVGETPSPASTAARALIGRQDRTVVLGFPDVLFEPPEAARRLLDALGASDEAGVVLGLFPHPRSRRADIVEVASDDRVRSVSREGNHADANWTWGLAAWRPAFTSLLVAAVAESGTDAAGRGAPDLGDLLQRAIAGGMRVIGRVVSDAPFLDIGTPEGLEEARRRVVSSLD